MRNEGPEKAILLVEDMENDAQILTAEFQRAGLANRIVWLSSAREALAYLSGEERYADRERFPFPTVLILDLKMPEADGFTVLQWIAARPQLRRLFTIVLSALEDTKSVQKAYSLGANSYLSKPINSFDIANLVQFFKGYWTIAPVSESRAKA
jgi:CheY-like chemotaxis protein